jgi:thiol peroxidase
MAQITLKGMAIHTSGNLPKTGDKAPDFSLTRTDLSDVSLKDFSGKKVVMNIFPSVDTAVCSTSVRKFNAEVNNFANSVVLCISRDLPFALERFCGAEGLSNVIPLSELRTLDFGERYGLRIIDGPLAGLLARAIVVLDETQKVIYTQLVPEIVQEPDYQSVFNILPRK